MNIFRQRLNTLISEELQLKLDIVDAIRARFKDPSYKSDNAKITGYTDKLLVLDSTDDDLYWTDPLCVSGSRLLEIYEDDLALDAD